MRENLHIVESYKNFIHHRSTPRAQAVGVLQYALQRWRVLLDEGSRLLADLVAL